MQGNYSTARSLHEEGLTAMQELEDRWGIALNLAGLGEVAIETGGPSRGVRLLGAAQALLAAIGANMGSDDRIPFDRAVASARTQLGEEAFENAWQAGQAMTLEQAIAYSLEDETSTQRYQQSRLNPIYSARRLLRRSRPQERSPDTPQD